jgi:D-alanine-D-alanine ligase-like ATP-grasp enzyme
MWYPEQKLNFYNQILPKIKSIATDAVKATYLKLDPKKREHAFEIFGLDFMIDENFHPLLIEINTNPDITTST